jgi:alginate O-acetyltransferase complex protein AlgI
VNIAWVFFRAKTFDKAWLILRGMAGMNAKAVPILAAVYLLTTALIVAALVGAHWYMRKRTLEDVIERVPVVALTGLWTCMAFAIVIEHGTGNAFIYFQF